MTEANDLNLPFEPSPPLELTLDDAQLSGGVAIMAATIPLGDELKPALVFRFATPTGGFYPPVVLVAEDDQLLQLPQLAGAAASHAVATARQARS